MTKTIKKTRVQDSTDDELIEKCKQEVILLSVTLNITDTLHRLNMTIAAVLPGHIRRKVKKSTPLRIL